MTIERKIQIPGLYDYTVSIELTQAEMRAVYDECQKNYRLEDIRNHLNDMDEDDLSGYAAEEITDKPELMGAMLQSFFKHESCELPENDVMEECIRTVLSTFQKKGTLIVAYMT